MLGLVFALSAAMAQADNCASVSPGLEFKTDLTGLTCSGEASKSKCDDNCCQLIKNSCLGEKEEDGDCGADKYFDKLKGAATVKSDGSDFGDKCCTARKVCDITCKPGYKDKKDKKDIKCKDEKCEDDECCDFDDSTCMGVFALQIAPKMAKGDKSDFCADKMTVPLAKGPTKATLSTFKDNCCEVMKKCDIPCPAGTKDKASKPVETCEGDKCSTKECCDNDETTCRYFPGKTCGTGKYKDKAKYGKAVQKDGSDFESVCCTDDAKCEAFKAMSLSEEGQASGAVRQSATALLLSAAGYFAMAK